MKKDNDLTTVAIKYREVIISVGVFILNLFLWLFAPLTNLSRTDNLIITCILWIFDLIIVIFSIILKKLNVFLSYIEENKLDDINDFNKLMSKPLNKLTLNAYWSDFCYNRKRATSMATDLYYSADKKEIYDELCSYCEALKTLDGQLMAVSAISLEDFINNDDAQKYIRENAELVKSGKCVRRIFILRDENDINKQDIKRILKLHSDAIKNTNHDNNASGVKWIAAKHAKDERACDFALFYPYIRISQQIDGRKLEVSQNNKQITDAVEVFNKLWTNPSSTFVSI